MSAAFLTGVWGVARRHRAKGNTGAPARREVAALTPAFGPEPGGVSEGSTVPLAPVRQHNGPGGKGPWFGVRLTETRGGRLA